MDKFTKTTEVDISSLNLHEEETPKKSKATKVVALIISLLLAVAIWLYVVETDESIVEKDFTVSVEVINDSHPNYEITADDITVTVKGTTSQLVDIDKSDIVAKVDMNAYETLESGSLSALVSITIQGDNDVTLKKQEPIYVTVNVKAK